MNQMQANLQRLLEERNLTVSSLARKANKSVSTVQNLIYGRTSNPTVTLLLSIAKALNCSITEILGTDSEYPSCSTTEDLYLFYDNLNVLTGILLEKKMPISIFTALKLASNAYEYCKANNKNMADKNFCNWLASEYKNKD